MRIIAYTYEADYHCIDCTKERFNTDTLDSNYPAQLNDANGVPTNPNRYHGSYGVIQLIDNEGNEIHPLFSIDEWQEFDEGFLAENPTQYLACGDCHEVIEEYTHTN
tara:strand:- start:293 stop:613 length:321 start_codon:yes stop_codon:yes gene_type:complete